MIDQLNSYNVAMYKEKVNIQDAWTPAGVLQKSIMVRTLSKKRKKYKLFRFSRQMLAKSSNYDARNIFNKPVTKQASTPEINTRRNKDSLTKKSVSSVANTIHSSKPNFFVNFVKERGKAEYLRNPFNNRVKFKIYRCQLATKQEACCCSCNSDAMFEVMKSLYDCYKKKNCDNCNCILCGHLPVEERRLGETRKAVARSTIGVGEETISTTERKKEKTKRAIKEMEGKPIAEKEKILRDLAKSHVPLPEPKTSSERELIRKIKKEYGLPPEPKTSLERLKFKRAEAAGLLTPLSGKTPWQKEKILKEQAEMGIPLPEGRTPSEKALIDNIKRTTKIKIPSEKWHMAKEAGLLTPLANKTPEQRERILKGLAMQGLPLPEGKSSSERKIIEKVRADLGIPPEPKTPSLKKKYKKATEAGLIVPLEGKTPSQKERYLHNLADRGLPLPTPRTPSEKAMINKIRPKIPSDKWRLAKVAGLHTPLDDKTPERKEEIIRGLAMQGLPLPEGKTLSEKALINKVRADLGLPPEPKTAAMKEKYKDATDAGLMIPLEGKTHLQKERILLKLAEKGLPLPEGRTTSEKALLSKVKATMKPPSEGIPVTSKIERAKAAGLLTPLEGKTPEQKENILKGLALAGIPLPEAKTVSERKVQDKVRLDLGFPPEPKSSAEKQKYKEAVAAGLIQPLEGKSPSEKEKILKALHNKGVPLPEGRTKSEKVLIKQIKSRKTRSRGISAGKAALPLEKRLKLDEKTAKVIKEGKGPADECICDILSPQTPSLTTEKIRKAKAAGLLTPLHGKTAEEKEKILKGLVMSRLPLPEGKTASDKALIKRIKNEAGLPDVSETIKLRQAREAGLLTPLKGKTLSQKEKIIRGRAAAGLPIPLAKTASEKQLVKKIKADTGYITPTTSQKIAKAKAAGLMTPLTGKSPSKKAKIIQERLAVGLPPPEGKSPSEIILIKKIVSAEGFTPKVKIPSEKIRRAKAAGLITPLEGKTPQQKEKILRGLVKAGLPLPKPQTTSERDLMGKIRLETGLPPEPTTNTLRKKYEMAQIAGIITPLQGKTTPEKETILRNLQDAGIPLPEGKTASEKALIQKVKAGLITPRLKIPSEKIRAAKAAGFLTPLQGKSPEQRERILKGLAKSGMPLPIAKTPSEREIIKKVRKDLGLPPEPETLSMKEKIQRAHAAGFITPLDGKTPSQKEKIVRKLVQQQLPTPQGRTMSEKAMIKKIKAEDMSKIRIPSDKIRRAKEAGLLTPLEGKTSAQKEEIMKGLAMEGIPLPEPKTASEKKLMEKVRLQLGLPPEPKTTSERRKFEKAMATGKIAPLEGKTRSEKAKILKAQAEMGMQLPEGRTATEKDLIYKIKEETKASPRMRIPSEKLRKAKEAGLLTPLDGKKSEEKERILKGLAMQGLPIPAPKTTADKKLVNKIRYDLGLPPEPKTLLERQRYEKAAALGIIQPLEGKTPSEKLKILKAQADIGLPLPEGRTLSEKALITQARLEARESPPSEKIRKAQAAGLVSPLEGKTQLEKERILRDMVEAGLPLPEPKTPSERHLINKVRSDMALPPEPKTASAKEKIRRAQAAGLIVPLEGKTVTEKEDILRGLAEAGVPLPKGRTPSETALISKIQATTSEKPGRTMSPKEARKLEEKTAKSMKEGQGPVDECICDILTPESEKYYKEPTTKGIPPEKIRQARAAGLLTPLKGKSPAQKEKLMRELAKQGLPLPETKTASEKYLADKVRLDLGIPPEPKTTSEKQRYAEAIAAGVIVPLEGKTKSEKEKIIRSQIERGIPPAGRTPSEKALIKKIKSDVKARSTVNIPSERIRRAKAAGLITPLEGKTSGEKEKILKGLAMAGIPLPEAKTLSEKNIMHKVRADLGLPPEPKTHSERRKYEEAVATGAIVPLEGKTKSEKEQILKEQAEMGISLPEGRTTSEKALIAKIKAETKVPPKIRIPSERIREAKAAGLLTPLEGKTSNEKERILKGLAMAGIPLPEAKTPSEKRLKEKIRTDLGLPPEPKTRTEQRKYQEAIAAGLIVPLEGKTASEKAQILRDQVEMGIALPEGRTASEKALIAKVNAQSGMPTKARIPSERIREAKAAGLLTPLEGKTSKEKERILKGLAMAGIPLPETKTPSEKRLVEKIRTDLGLPPEPKTRTEQKKYQEAIAAGVIVPLEGKTASEKAQILRDQAEMGIALPVGRTASEKALITKIRAETTVPTKIRIPSERIREAKAAGLLTPLEGKTSNEKERILKGLAMAGIPLPEAKTPSEKRLKEKIRTDLGLPPEPKTRAEQRRYNEAIAAGVIVPLEGKTTSEKAQILRDQVEMGIALPEGRTTSEKALIAKVKAQSGMPTKARIPSERIREAKAAGLLTPLEGKTSNEKERILKGLAMAGIPLPETKTMSEKKIMEKVRADLGLPPEPKTHSERKRYKEAVAAGVLLPLEGKTKTEKEQILKEQAQIGIALPEGRTTSEKALIAKIKAETKVPPRIRIPSERIREAKAAGLLTPLEGKTSNEKERILKGLAMAGMPLPEAKTPSEKRLKEKIRTDLGLPPEPKTRAEQRRYDEAIAAGVIVPLEGKTASEKARILRDQVEMGIALPLGRTASEKALIAKIKKDTLVTPSANRRQARAGLMTPLKGKTTSQKETILKGLAESGLPLPKGKTSSEKVIISKVQAEIEGRPPIRPPLPPAKLQMLDKKTGKIMKEGKGPADECICDLLTPESDRIHFKQPPKIVSERLRKARAAGILTPLEGKSPSYKERVMKELAMQGLPLPEAKTESEKKIADKVRTDLGLPPEPKTWSEKRRFSKALAADIIQPLEGKTPTEKEKTLRALVEKGIPLPKGRTASEKALISRVKATAKETSRVRIPSEKIRKAKVAGLLTPLQGKSHKEKENIMKGLVMEGIPLPKAKSASEDKLMQKIRTELGLPPQPKSASERKRYEKAIASGVVVPLEGKTTSEKEKTLRAQAALGLELPVGRTTSEKALIEKIKTESERVPSEKLRRAKAAGLVTPLQGKTLSQKEKIVKGLTEMGLPLPEGQTASEKIMMQKIRADLGLVPPARTQSEKEIVRDAQARGLFTPIAGKTTGQKEKILQGLAEAGLPLPEGKTASEKELVKKIRIAAGLPAEPTPSEKRGVIRSKTKRVGATAKRHASRKIGEGRIDKELAAVGVDQEFEDVTKTTTCERACGCDRKKIRFKHSYVKIRVTSPDISSLCPCPEECIPGVKGGIFTDNEGIKVTIGHAVGVASYARHNTGDNTISKNIMIMNINSDETGNLSTDNNFAINANLSNTSNTIRMQRNDNIEYLFINKSLLTICSEESLNNCQMSDDSERQISCVLDNDELDVKHIISSMREPQLALIRSNVNMKSIDSIISVLSTNISLNMTPTFSDYDSILLLKSESSLCLTTLSCNSNNTTSIVSAVESNCISIPDQYTYHSQSGISTESDELDYYEDESDCSYFKNKMAIRKQFICTDDDDSESVTPDRKKSDTKMITIKNGCHHEEVQANSVAPILVMDRASGNHDIRAVLDDLLSSTEFSTASAIYIIVSSSEDLSDTDEYQFRDYVPTSDTISEYSYSHLLGSRISPIACTLKLSRTAKSNYTEKISPQPKPRLHIISNRTQAFDIENNRNKDNTLRNRYQDYDSENNGTTEHVLSNSDIKTGCRPINMTQNTRCLKNECSQIVSLTKNKDLRRHCETSTDTAQDRPCCCMPKKLSTATSSFTSSGIHCVANVISSLAVPTLQQGNTELCNNPCSPPRRFTNNQSSLPLRDQLPPMMPVQFGHSPGPYAQYKFPQTWETKDKIRQPNHNMHSVGCGNYGCMEDLVNLKKNQKKFVNADTGAYTGENPQKSTLDAKTGRKTDKKVTLVPPVRDVNEGKKSVGCQCCLHGGCKQGLGVQYTGVNITGKSDGTTQPLDIFLKDHCVCKNKHNKKSKIVCLCPPPTSPPPTPLPPEPEAEEEPEYDDQYLAYEEYDYSEEDLWKQRSEKTQTTSGFKVTMRRKNDDESDMSFEEALEYYASVHGLEFGEETEEHNVANSKGVDTKDFQIKGEKCDCEDRAKKKKNRNKCECEYIAEDEHNAEVESDISPDHYENKGWKQGLKFAMGGKGSASKGLAGICCFDMLQDSNTYMVGYLDESDSYSVVSFY